MASRKRIQKPKKHRETWTRDPSEQVFGDSRRKRTRDQEIKEIQAELQEALEEIDEWLT